MKYEDPACAYCPDNVRACRVGESEVRGPGFCPSRVDPDGIDAAAGEYDVAEIRRISQVSAVVEAEGYGKWPRVLEICEFAKRMGFKKVGIATCISFVDHAKVLSGILESHGLEVASVACKHGSIPKEELGLKEEEKVRPGNFEAICNPAYAVRSTFLVSPATTAVANSRAATAADSDAPVLPTTTARDRTDNDITATHSLIRIVDSPYTSVPL